MQRSYKRSTAPTRRITAQTSLVPASRRRSQGSAHPRKRQATTSATRLRIQVQYKNGVIINMHIGKAWLATVISVIVAMGAVQIGPVLELVQGVA